MNGPAQERRAHEIFARAVDIGEHERAAFLERECDGDAELRSFVERMFAADRSNEPVFDGVAALATAVGQTPGPSDKPPDQIGHYRVIREIGRGGMGIVYECEQEHPKRRVAVKIIHSGFYTKEVLWRFNLEARVLGMLDHPGIAHVYEAGTATIGASECPYLAMELVDGRGLRQHVAETDLTPDERVELIARVCDGVQHAHQKGVIHRDLKPANIVVKAESAGGDADRIGQPKILDFGVARAMDADPHATTLRTTAGQIVGTLSYMRPEQIEGLADEVDTRSDVYSLGVMLYELLSGQRPLDLHTKTIAEAARIIRDHEPRRLGSHDRVLRGDLETITSKALEKHRERRYASAAELAQDLRRYLNNEPVLAAPVSTLYQARKFATRNKALVGGSAATIVALVAGLATSLVLLNEVAAQRDAADIARAEAETAQQRSERIAAFQGRIFERLRANTVGETVAGALRSHHEVALETLDDPARARARESFESVIGAVNFSDVGNDVLNAEIGDRAVQILEDHFASDPAVESSIRRGVGRLLQRLDRHAEAAEQFRTSSVLDGERLGPDGIMTVRNTVSYAATLALAGNEEAAIEILDEVLARPFERLPEHEDVRLRAEIARARIMVSQGDDAEATELLTHTLAFAREYSSGEFVTDALNELGVLALRAGDTQLAMSYFDEYIAAAGGEINPSRPDDVNAFNNIMATLFAKNQLEDAERYARWVLRSFSDLNGMRHPSTVMARNNLGRVCFALGRVDEAIEHWYTAYEQARALPLGNEVREATATNLTDALLANGNPAEAEALARSLLQERREAQRPNPPAIAQTLEQLAASLANQNLHGDALDAYQECLALREGVSDDHWLTHRSRGTVGVALIEVGRIEEGRPLVAASLESLERVAESIPANMRERELTNARDRAARAGLRSQPD